VRKTRAEIKTKAAEIWQGMDKNQRHGVRFGMFPSETMASAEKEGFESPPLVCALMDCASADGGMRG
jgi:hypothetical protein